MLVLTRKKGESIVIGDSIEITVVQLDSGRVQLGITAPKHIPVHRREVYLAIQANRESSSSTTNEE